jgi:hypothetical protein
MAEVQVTCITKPHPSSNHEHITHIGGFNWKWDRDMVIRSVEAKQNVFYVIDPVTGKKAYIGVVRPRDGRAPYLQTYADGTWNNNLLSLPQCP